MFDKRRLPYQYQGVRLIHVAFKELMRSDSKMKANIGTVMLPLVVLGMISGVARGQEQYMAPGANVQDYRGALMQSRGIRPSRVKRSSKNAAAAATGSNPSVRRAESDIYRPSASSDVASGGGVSVQIFFAHDSAMLTADAKSELDKLGQALAAPAFSQDRWFIEGHTDASGAADYNEDLSQRRAFSAMSYLVENHRIAPDVLIPVGKGESEPYDPEKPYSNINRRVRIKHAGD